jgi:hypothetical protein
VFGFPIGNHSDEANRYRANRWCPFNNPTGANCTKDSITDPLGVCSIHHAGSPVITCPVRFRQDWRIIEDAVAFFFPPRPANAPLPRMLSEVPLRDGAGREAGNVDVVLLDLDENGVIRDYGALEVQAVYISGSVRPIFRHYMNAPDNPDQEWPSAKIPRPDYLSSSRKRLAPQLLYKGTLLNHWRRKIAVAVQREFFATLPVFPEVDPAEADLAWLIYDLNHDPASNRYNLQRAAVVYTLFKPALTVFTVPPVTDEQRFLADLQRRLVGRETAPDLAPMPELFDSLETDATDT